MTGRNVPVTYVPRLESPGSCETNDTGTDYVPIQNMLISLTSSSLIRLFTLLLGSLTMTQNCSPTSKKQKKGDFYTGSRYARLTSCCVADEST